MLSGADQRYGTLRNPSDPIGHATALQDICVFRTGSSGPVPEPSPGKGLPALRLVGAEAYSRGDGLPRYG
jgi:hypothetical protein